MFSIVADLACRMGSSIAELCKILILTGAIFEYLRFEDQSHLDKFADSMQRLQLADQVDEENPLKEALMSLGRTQSILVSGPQRNTPHIEGSELIKVRLSPGFVRRIDLYTKLTGSTRSALLTRFFTKGLLLYLRSQTALLKALDKVAAKAQDPLTKTTEDDATKPA